jgi:ribosomal protein S27AE
MTGTTTWRTDDPCPACGTGLLLTEDGAEIQLAQDCPLCGWSAIWQAALNMDDYAPGSSASAGREARS